MSCDGKHATFWICLIASCGYLTCYPVLSISCRSKGWSDSGLVLGGGVQCTVSPLIVSCRPAFSVAKIGGWVQMAKVWRLHGESPPVFHPVVPPMDFLYIFGVLISCCHYYYFLLKLSHLWLVGASSTWLLSLFDMTSVIFVGFRQAVLGSSYKYTSYTSYTFISVVQNIHLLRKTLMCLVFSFFLIECSGISSTLIAFFGSYLKPCCRQ